jgi:hypothetical protein
MIGADSGIDHGRTLYSIRDGSSAIRGVARDGGSLVIGV